MAFCWGITGGAAGMAAQVQALAQALDITPDMKTVTIPQPFASLPTVFYHGKFGAWAARNFIGGLEAPWPQLVISCGRKGAMAALGMRALGADGFFLHIQDPRVRANWFDLIIAMEHDNIRADNVLTTRFALHAITPQALARAHAAFAPRFAGYASPRIAVLLGGSTHNYTLTQARMVDVIANLQRVLALFNGSLLITASRRTGAPNRALLAQAFAGNPRVYLYDDGEENPYLGLLALADTLIVSNDSVNMMTDASATGKPLYLLPLPGHSGTKPARFAEMLMAQGIARPLEGTLKRWIYKTEDEMAVLAEEIKRRLPYSFPLT